MFYTYSFIYFAHLSQFLAFMLFIISMHHTQTGKLFSPLRYHRFPGLQAQ